MIARGIEVGDYIYTKDLWSFVKSDDEAAVVEERFRWAAERCAASRGGTLIEKTLKLRSAEWKPDKQGYYVEFIFDVYFPSAPAHAD